MQLMRSTSTLATPVLAGDAVVADSFKPGSVDVLSALPGAQPVRLFHIAGEFSVPVARVRQPGAAADVVGGRRERPLRRSAGRTADEARVVPTELSARVSAGARARRRRVDLERRGLRPNRLRIQFGSLSRIVDASGRPGPLAAAGLVAWVDADPNANTTVATRRLTIYDAQAGSVAYSVRRRVATVVFAFGSASTQATNRPAAASGPGRPDASTMRDRDPNWIFNRLGTQPSIRSRSTCRRRAPARAGKHWL